MSSFRRLESIPVGNVLGESILWDVLSRRLWWTDIQAQKLHCYEPKTMDLRVFALPERMGSFGFVDGADGLVCAFESGIALYTPENGALRWLYRPEQGFSGTRFNDGRVDRQGRFWSGTMVEGDGAGEAESIDADGRPVRASLYCVTRGHGRRVFGGIGISNSLCFSLDSRTMYFADSPTRQILAFAFDPATAEIGERRVFATTGAGVPDGSVIDAEGYLWNAEWGGSKLVRYAPTGQVALELALPVSQPTCVCFGGEHMDLMFVTTATDGLEADAREREPEAGNVLVYETRFKGVPESRYLPESA